MKPLEYSLNDLLEKYSADETKVEKRIETTKLGFNSWDEKIYTETDFQKVLDFTCLKKVENNPFCGKKDCFDILPNHLHSEELEKERKSKILLKIKVDFFVEEWFYFYKTGGNKLESEISKKLAPIFEGKVHDGKKIQETYDWFRSYIENIENYLPHSPKLELIEKKWRNKKTREEWLKSNYWDQWQVMVEKPNLFSFPKTWILTAIILSLAAIGWVFYHRRKNNEKNNLRQILELIFKLLGNYTYLVLNSPARDFSPWQNDK